VNLATPPRKILCSTDFSEPSYAALKVAGEWATHFGAELCLIHVVEPIETPGMLLSSEHIEEAMQAEAVQRLHTVLREHLPQLAAARPIVRKGSAADEIAVTAEQENADLIVIATHGSSGWRAVVSGTVVERILFGSVTTNVLRLTSCPVLTVRLPVEPSVFEGN
jgi:nucleotide-binding universal stress UspA family protein